MTTNAQRTAQLHDLLDTGAVQKTPLSRLDWAFAQLLQHRQPSDNPHHLWLAALTSHQWSRGHACLDVRALQHDPGGLLGWDAAQLALLPEGLLAQADTACANLPWCDGPASPLVLQRDAHTASLQLNSHQSLRLYLRRAWWAEQTVGEHLRARVSDEALPTATGRTTTTDQHPNADLSARLDDLFGADSAAPDAGNHAQRKACEVAVCQGLCLITGGPGTGKTTTVVRLLALLLGLSPDAPLRIHLAAPTGKAAARLVQSITAALADMPASVRARIPTQAQTLHRLLGSVQTHQTLATDVVVVDEASMIDLEMMARLLRSVPPTARLVLLGDRDQLASVQAGAVMAQLCDLPWLAPCIATLTRSHRFDPERGIGRWAQSVHEDPASRVLPSLWQATPRVPIATSPATSPTPDTPRPDTPWPDVTRFQEGSDAELAALVHHGWHDWRQLLAAIVPTQACTDAQALALLQAWGRMGVLCATRDGPQGVLRLTQRIERCLQLPAADALGWYPGRPVMVTRNDYALGLMNGDIGLCLPHPEGGLRVAFAEANGGVRWLATARLGAVDTVWAMTVHKSQGSEFHHVLLALPSEASPVLTREWVYTGLTRARQGLTLWAPNPEVLYQACARRVLRSGGLADLPA
jgi:exodeoxyribonuclease V alpha subunit